MKKILFFFISIFLFSCQSEKYVSLKDYPQEKSKIIFGNGGGFTGQVNAYVLLENGQLFSSNSLTNETKELKVLKKKELKTLFKNMEALQMEKRTLDNPSNMYQFLEFVKEGKIHKYQWGNLKDKPEFEDVGKMYEQLIGLLKREN
jgi:exopolysaccharide biosynthesis protein